MTLIGTVTLLSFGCQKKVLTQQDVQGNVEEAREATQEAKDKTQKALDSRQQYTQDYRDQKAKELQDRSTKIDERIKELRKIAKDSPNQEAVQNINTAIDALEKEKSDIGNRIEKVKAIQPQDWSTSYEEINQSVTRIEAQLDKLAESLKQ